MRRLHCSFKTRFEGGPPRRRSVTAGGLDGGGLTRDRRLGMTAGPRRPTEGARACEERRPAAWGFAGRGKRKKKKKSGPGKRWAAREER
jgi:hypothetical protein